MRVKQRTLWAMLLAIVATLAASQFTIQIKEAPSTPLSAQSSPLWQKSAIPNQQISTQIPNRISDPVEAAQPSQGELEAKLPPKPKFAPKFERVGKYTTTIPANGDRADVYYPLTTKRNPAGDDASKAKPATELPIALLLQGFNVENSVYSQFATQIAKHGFVVIAPNHFTSVRGKREIFAQVGQVSDVLAFAQAENQNLKSPLAGAIDVTKLVLIGHSHGGFIGMDAIRGACDPPWCVSKYVRPPELMAGVFYGADLWDDGNYISIKNDRIPIAFIVGSKDSLIADNSVKSTYQLVQTPPKAFVRVLGANHYGLADLDNPQGSPKEKNPPAIAQDISRETISRWTAAFLRAYATQDPDAIAYLSYGAASDRGVEVLRQE
jgi:dienelactone hydrolase